MSFALMDGRYMDAKEKISGALDAVKTLEAVKYTEHGINGGTKYGFDGKTVADAAPAAAVIDGVGMSRVDLVALIPVLAAAIQELAAKVETKRSRTTKAPE